MLFLFRGLIVRGLVPSKMGWDGPQVIAQGGFDSGVEDVIAIVN